jgi:hypothetical protein
MLRARQIVRKNKTQLMASDRSILNEQIGLELPSSYFFPLAKPAAYLHCVGCGLGFHFSFRRDPSKKRIGVAYQQKKPHGGGLYQGISPVVGLVSSLINLPVTPSLSNKAYFTMRCPASATSPPL